MTDDLFNLDVAANEPKTGDVIAGKYELGEIIGRGGFGLVYGATNLAINQTVALKVLLPEWANQDPELSIRFRREAVLASQLRHPNTITLYDYGGTGDGLLYMAMEFVDGRTLSTVLRDEAPVAQDRVIKILVQILASLDEAHRRGIVHRDLKPGNIMLTEHRDEEFVKVLDFGIAKAVAPGLLSGRDISQTLTQAGQFCGTPRYMAPEQFRNTTITPAADLYSLGLIAYELLTGEQAVYGETMVDLIVQQVAGPDLRLPAELALDESLREAVNQALRKTPRKRFGSANEFSAALLGDEWSPPDNPDDRLSGEHVLQSNAPESADKTAEVSRIDTRIDDDGDDFGERPTEAIGPWELPDTFVPPERDDLDFIETNHNYKLEPDSDDHRDTLDHPSMPPSMGDTVAEDYTTAEDQLGTNPIVQTVSADQTTEFDKLAPRPQPTRPRRGSADVTVDISRNELFAAELARDAVAPPDLPAPAAADAARSADQTVDIGDMRDLPPAPRFASRLERNVRRGVSRSTPEAGGEPSRGLTGKVGLSIAVLILFLVVVAISAQVAHTVWKRTQQTAVTPTPVAVPDAPPRVTRHERLKDPSGPRVSVRINSTPTGATVFEGERRLGRTPIDLVRTRGTSQRIRVILDGHLEHSMTVEFDKGRVYPVRLRKR